VSKATTFDPSVSPCLGVSSALNKMLSLLSLGNEIDLSKLRTPEDMKPSRANSFLRKAPRPRSHEPSDISWVIKPTLSQVLVKVSSASSKSLRLLA
jgi:hypothetical protein